MAKGNDGLGNHAVVVVDQRVSDERLVDFQTVDGELAQIAQRRIARTEVIDGQLDAQLVQLVQNIDGNVHVFHEHAFGHFQLQPFGVKAAFFQCGGGQRDDVRAVELHARNVDGDAERRQAFILPLFVDFAGGFHDPLANRHDKAGLFGNRNEIRG